LEAIKTLRIFFVDALHSNVKHADASKLDATGKLLAFVQKNYVTYQQDLLDLFQTKRPVKLQLAAMMALMETTRAGALSEQLSCLVP
jgi:hypothetical protein